MGNTFFYNANASNYNDMFLGGAGSHRELIVDLGFLPTNIQFITHFTMGCGNDNIMGQGIIPNPEPATMILFGLGLLGLAGVSRRNQKSSN